MKRARHAQNLAFSVLLTLAASNSADKTLALANADNSAAVKSWTQVQSRGDRAFFLSEYGNAERLLKQAEQQARTLQPPQAIYAKSSGELGRLLTIRGRFGEAEPYLEEEFRIKEKTIGNGGGQLIPEMGALIKFYLNYGTASKARDLTDSLLFFVEGRMREADQRADGKISYKKGVPLQAWAGDAAPQARDPLLEWAITCDDLGNQYVARNDLDMADRLFKAALDMKSTILGKEHLSLANSYDSLGKVCMQRNQLDQAENFFRDALNITEKIQPPGHPQIYARQDRLARCLIRENKFSEAEDIYKSANEAMEKNPSTVGNEARGLYALGSLYCDEKKYSDAADTLAKAYKASAEFNGVDSVDVVPYLRKYAYALYYLGRKGESDSLKARADQISPFVQPLKATAKSLETQALPVQPEAKTSAAESASSADKLSDEEATPVKSTAHSLQATDLR